MHSHFEDTLRDDQQSMVIVFAGQGPSWQQQQHQNFIILKVLLDVNELTSSYLHSLGIRFTNFQKNNIFVLFFFPKPSQRAELLLNGTER